MRKIIIIFMSLFILGSVNSHPIFAQSINDVTIMTEEYPPINFTEDGVTKGIATDFIVAILERMGSTTKREDIKVLPWANGYNSAQNTPNTMLYSTTRTVARENLFKWVGPVIATDDVLLAKKDSNITINTPEDINKYQVGVIRDDVSEQLLVDLGVKDSSLQRVAKFVSNIKKIETGRVDLIAYGETTAKWLIKQEGYNTEEYEVVYYIVPQGEKQLYFAFHKDTPDSLIQEVQKVVDELKADGTYQAIVDKYQK